MKRTSLLALCLAAAAVYAAGCASNPATGGKTVVTGTMDGEKKTVQKITDVTFGPDFAVEWINQCHHIVQKLYTELPAPDANGYIVLGTDYQKAQKQTLDRQLATGGLRLAALLNAVLGGQ